MDILTELIKSGDKEYTSLIDAISRRDVLKSVVYTHQFLGYEYLDVQQLFTDFEGNRKTEEKVTNFTSLDELNTAIRKCHTEKLSELISKRGDLLQSLKKYNEAIKDYRQCLNFSNNPNSDYMVYNKIAQVLFETNAISYICQNLYSILFIIVLYLKFLGTS